MAFLEIIHISGEVDQKKLSKREPLTIGSHASTDITIDEDNVEIMHCRISWGKDGYEAVAAGTEPIEFNGNLVQRATLKAGDTLRFGSVDIRYRGGKEDGKNTPAPAEDNKELGLKPLSEDVPTLPKSVSRKATPAVDESNEDDIIEDDLDLIEDEEDDDLASGSIAEGLAALAAESQESMTVRPSKKKKQKPKPKSKPAPQSATKSKPKTPAASPAQPQKSEPTPKPDPVPRDDGLSPRMREAMRSQQRRPGEEDPLRSPLVLGLAGGAVVLMLSGAIFFFMASRQTTQQVFDQAKAVYDDGKFQNAINEFNSFIIAYPRQEITEEAKTLLGLAKIRQQIESATPNFEEGLTQLRAFIREHSDREDAFEALHPEIVTHAKKISVEAAQTAGKRFDPALMKISREARTILNTYTPKDAPPTETLNQIESALRSAEAAILKNGVYKEHIERMDVALKSEDPAKTSPLDALKARRDLLVRYPKKSPTDRRSFESDKKVVGYFKKALALEQKKVVHLDNHAEAIAEDHPSAAVPLSLSFHGRTRIDEVSVGKSVIVVAKDCCYGVDFVTGDPVWRRVIGFDSPFFPLQESQLPSVILFDTNHLELVRLNQTTGQLIWRQSINDFISGRPLLVDNTIYAATEKGRLLAFDLETGAIAGELNFSQPISSPVELRDDKYLFVTGNEEVCYTISKRPFECVQVSYLGQQPASIEAPLLAMGPYVLMIENKTNSATLRLLGTADPKKPIKQVDSAKVTGRVIDNPVIRGRSLFVPVTGEKINSFSVSDDPGQPPLTAGPIFEGQGDLGESINLLTGPNGQVWMATDSLNRLQLTTDSLQPDGAPKAAGIATQPLQMFSGFLLNARRRPFTDAVTFTRTDRNDMTSDWQIVLGGKILAVTGQGAGTVNIAAINEAGHAFRIGERQLTGGSFLTKASFRLQLDPDLVDPLVGATISGNRLAVACGDPKPRLWIINAAGQVEGSPRIPEPLQVPPCALGNRVVLPLPGRLHVARLSGQSAIQDYTLATGEDHIWRSVTPVGEDQIVAVTQKGLVLLLKLKSTPRPHLSEVAKIELGVDVLVNAASNDKFIAIADASNTLTLFNTTRLDPIATKKFDQPVSNHPFIVDGMVLVESGGQQFHAMKPADLSDIFVMPLNQVSVAGVVKTESNVIVAQQNGDVSYLDPESGEVANQQKVNSVLSSGPIQIGKNLFVIAVDGTLFRLE